MKVKKGLKLLALAMLILLISSAVFALPITENVLVIGNKAYNLNYLMTGNIDDEIMAALVGKSLNDMFVNIPGITTDFQNLGTEEYMTPGQKAALSPIEYINAQGETVIYANFGDEEPINGTDPDDKTIIEGPGGVEFIIPGDDYGQDIAVNLDAHNANVILGPGEQAASSAVKVSLDNGSFVHGASDGNGNYPLYELRFPITVSGVDPQSLYMKVKVSDGAVLPVTERYDPVTNTYIVTTLGLQHDWVMGVVSGAPVSSVQSKLQQQDLATASLGIAQWPSTEVIIDYCVTAQTKKLDENDIKNHILPIAQHVVTTFQDAGFIAPNWRRNDDNKYKMYLINNSNRNPNNPYAPDYSYYEPSNDKKLLGRVYIYYETYVQGDYQNPAAWNFKNVIAHEIFHAVQYGYGYHWIAVDSQYFKDTMNDKDWQAGSATIYEEGTANLVAGSYEAFNHIGAGSATLTDPGPGLRHNLGEALDDVNKNPYFRQDFFAFITKRYFNGGLHHFDSLFKAIAQASKSDSELNAAELALRYRQGLNDFLKQNNQTLPHVYKEYALQRLYVHERAYLLTEGEVNDYDQESGQFQKNALAWQSLLTEGTTYFSWKSNKSNEFDYDPLTFKTIKPLSSVAAKMEIPDALPDEIEEIPITINLSEGEITNLMDQEGMTMVIIRERYGAPVSSNASVVVTNIDEPVLISLKEGDEKVSHLTIIAINSYIQDVTVGTLELTVGEPEIDLNIHRLYLCRNDQEYPYILFAQGIPAGIQEVRFEWDFGDSKPGSQGVSPAIPVNDGKAKHVVHHSYRFDFQLENYDGPPFIYDVTAVVKDHDSNDKLAEAEAPTRMLFPLEGTWDIQYETEQILKSDGTVVNKSGQRSSHFYYEPLETIDISNLIWDPEHWLSSIEVESNSIKRYIVSMNATDFLLKIPAYYTFLLYAFKDNSFTGNFTDRDNWTAEEVLTDFNRDAGNPGSISFKSEKTDYTATRQDCILLAYGEPIFGGTVTINAAQSSWPQDYFRAREVLKGETATLVAEAAEGYTFDGWYEGNNLISTGKSYQLTVQADKVYTAKFIKQP